MREEFIRAFDKTILGVLRYEDNGDQRILDFPSRKILGMYIAAEDSTREFPSRIIVSKGNTLTMLLYKYKNIK